MKNGRIAIFQTGTNKGRTSVHLWQYRHPLPLPMGEVAERSEVGKGHRCNFVSGAI